MGIGTFSSVVYTFELLCIPIGINIKTSIACAK